MYSKLLENLMCGTFEYETAALVKYQLLQIWPRKVDGIHGAVPLSHDTISQYSKLIQELHIHSRIIELKDLIGVDNVVTIKMLIFYIIYLIYMHY